MEICGIPTEKVIEQSRKKEHYFDVDYSPFLIEDEEMGILRIPESRRLEDAVPCSDELFIDFVKQCLELDPDIRFTPSEAMKHPWI
jgi:dual specificity tyrosine-phosphorylation-regulated kinase 1/dual specificity tyrosine-phosphorylation-regulated kinase 2/3/4